jgi:hypothetical protein
MTNYSYIAKDINTNKQRRMDYSIIFNGKSSPKIKLEYGY